MHDEWIEALSKRGEQLTKALIAETSSISGQADVSAPLIQCDNKYGNYSGKGFSVKQGRF